MVLNTFSVTYGDFVSACWRKIRDKDGKKVDLATFATRCTAKAVEIERAKPPKERKKKEPSYSEGTLRNYIKGYKSPGRELLEVAAILADTTLEACLRPPGPTEINDQKDEALSVFVLALEDSRAQRAIRAALELVKDSQKNQASHGGKNRKH